LTGSHADTLEDRDGHDDTGAAAISRGRRRMTEGPRHPTATSIVLVLGVFVAIVLLALASR
jgi:hypothetical protein